MAVFGTLGMGLGLLPRNLCLRPFNSLAPDPHPLGFLEPKVLEFGGIFLYNEIAVLNSLLITVNGPRQFENIFESLSGQGFLNRRNIFKRYIISWYRVLADFYVSNDIQLLLS
jgi:hypothetical protein